MSSQDRVIVLVDLDSFYPSVEVRENPFLKGLPVIVGADPKARRGVVVSCSYEARKLGIHAGQPISRAHKTCPDAIYLRPNFPLYGRVSRRVMDILRGFANKFEQVSIDEAFLDITKKVKSYQEARKLALQIKKDVLENEGLTCSVGVAPNKSTAKIAANQEKPNGLTVVEPAKIRDFLSPLPVSAITGVGTKTREFLKSKSVETIGDLQTIPGKDLVKYFGKTGVWLWGVAQGLEQIEVRERTIMKSLSAEHTFEQDVLERSTVYQKLDELTEKLHGRLLSVNYDYRVVGIRIRFTHFQTYTRENTLPAYTDDKEVLRVEAKNLLKEFEGNNRKVRLIGLRVSDLRISEKSDLALENWLPSP